MPNKHEWLARVAGIAASNLAASSDGELTGLDEARIDALSDAEYQRLQWAKSEVIRRLDQMGRLPVTVPRGSLNLPMGGAP